MAVGKRYKNTSWHKVFRPQRGQGALGRGSSVLLILLGLAVFFPAVAGAANTYDLIGGSELDTEGQSFSYLGAGTSRPLDRQYSVTGKIFTGYLRYKFDSGGKTLVAKVPIATPSVGIKYQKEMLTLAGSIGVDFRESEKELASGGSETKKEAGVALQGEAYMQLEDKKSLEFIASYSSIDSFFWARGRVKKGVYVIGENTDLKIGAEAAGMGNSDFSAYQAGALAEFYNIPLNFSVLFKGGYKNTSASGGMAYGGVELYHGF